MEIDNMPHKDFRVMVIKIPTGLDKSVDELGQNFNKDIQTQKESVRDERFNK